MIVDGNGNLFEDRRKSNRRRKNEGDVAEEHRKEDRRKTSNVTNRSGRKSKY